MLPKLDTKGQAGIAALFLFCALSGPACAQSFSADLVVVKAGGVAAGEGTVHVGDDKVRIEAPTSSNSIHSG